MRLKTGLIASGIIIAAMCALSVWAWSTLPADAQIPIHWDIYGQPDRYAGKAVALLFIPILTTGIAILLAILPKIEPRREHLARSSDAYTLLWISLVLFMALIHTATVLTALGRPINFTSVIVAGAGLLFIVIGGMLWRIRSNFFVGIRTPWTLSSELAWQKTQRLGGWMFIVLGVLLVLLSPLASGYVNFIILIVGVLSIGITTAVYSFLVWKSEQTR